MPPFGWPVCLNVVVQIEDPYGDLWEEASPAVDGATWTVTGRLFWP